MHVINVLLLNAQPVTFPHAKQKPEAMESLAIFAFGYKQFISHLSCHGEGYYLLEQVAVLQKGHAGRGHLCRIEKSFGLSTI